MIIESVHVKNYRSILDETLQCESLTALVGANGVGKSSFLKALDLFYSPTPKIDSEDFYNGDIAAEIVVGVTFRDLSAEAKQLFSNYIQDDKLTVDRIFELDGAKVGSKYHGATLQCPDFQGIRDGLTVKDRGKTAKDAYEAIRAKPDFNSLPEWSTLGAVENNLIQWEAEHSDKCTRQQDDGQFFGFKEVAQGYLGRFTRFLFIQAVRDASEDAAESRGSALTDLMDLVVRSVLAQKEEVIRLESETNRLYKEIMNPSQQTELTSLADEMTKTLKIFVPNASIDLIWMPPENIVLRMPQAIVKLVEDGFSTDVSRTGHGLQRAFILTMLQHLALAQTSSGSGHENQEETTGSTVVNKLPNLVLAIEEPELYQHPNRQRHLAEIFLKLASGKTPGVAEKTQIIYGTHSPLFVGIDRIDQIRLLRKISNGEGKPKITKVVSTSLDKVAETVWITDGKPGQKYNGSTILPRLQAIMTPWMSEGFFADVAVLVEGEDDRAAIMGVGKAMGHEFEGNGFSVIPCGGKTNIDRPYIIFHKLDIPVYIIWDGDCGKGETEGACEKCGKPLDKKADPNENKRLLRLIGKEEIDWPEYIEDTFACFKNDLETTLENDIGKELFERCLEECQSNFCISKRKHAIKNPNVIMTIIKKAEEQGHSSSSLKSIVEKILVLKK